MTRLTTSSSRASQRTRRPSYFDRRCFRRASSDQQVNERTSHVSFLSGYTSKLAGTERGITTPEATFSTCFGSPFLPLPAHVYAEMLGRKSMSTGSASFSSIQAGPAADTEPGKE
ncbi:phosphoenolpyruvate carboxykinase (ATP) [Bacillus licheniformis]|nr:phosphoenolpyruvate carboxykinase (ATP) [Bacillus licheniformis]